jgi:hypothetical protein
MRHIKGESLKQSIGMKSERGMRERDK